MRKATEPMITPTEIECAMLAAYIDGEGCVYIAKTKRPEGSAAMPSYKLVVNVHNGDPRLIEWIKDRFGGQAYLLPSYYKDGADRRKPLCRWEIVGPKAGKVIEKIAKYSVIKRTEMELALSFCKISDLQGTPFTRAEKIEMREFYKKGIAETRKIPHKPNLTKIWEVKSRAA